MIHYLIQELEALGGYLIRRLLSWHGLLSSLLRGYDEPERLLPPPNPNFCPTGAVPGHYYQMPTAKCKSWDLVAATW
jgi:hypothetical protein